jgi:predicted dehydrogenase
LRRKDALERFRQDFGAHIYDDIDALCKDKDVDAVYISTAPEFGTPQGKRTPKA